MRGKYNIDRRSYSPSAELTHKTTTHIPAGTKIRPLRDVIIVEPLGVAYSAIIDVVHETKPLKGIVKAVGPGHYRKHYDHPEKHKRTKTWDSKHLTPTEVKVGDIVELGGAEQGGYAFDTFYWGDILHLIATERDVCGIHISPELDSRPAPQPEEHRKPVRRNALG